MDPWDEKNEIEGEKEDEGTLCRCPLRDLKPLPMLERIIHEVSLNLKYPTEFGTFLGVDTFLAKTSR